MASVKQTIVEPVAAETSKVYGARSDINLLAAYPESPILSGDYTDLKAIGKYNNILTEPNTDGGLGVASFNPDYTDNGAPDFGTLTTVLDDNGNEIEIGQGGGAPTTQYVPPLVSPGKGNFAASEQGPWTGNTPSGDGIEYGSGMQHPNPSLSAEKIEAQKIGDTLTSGRSYNGSDGKSS